MDYAPINFYFIFSQSFQLDVSLMNQPITLPKTQEKKHARKCQQRLQIHSRVFNFP